MSNVLIVYGSTYGQTERIACRIRAGLERHGHAVTLIKGDDPPADLCLGDFQGFVIAASVIRSRHQRYMADFARQHAARLNRGLTAFVSVCGAAKGSPDQASEYVANFLAETGLRPALVEICAGAIAYTRYGLLLRWVMRLISERRGLPTDMSRDHDLTDWNAVDRLAQRVAQALSAAPRQERIANASPPIGYPAV